MHPLYLILDPSFNQEPLSVFFLVILMESKDTKSWIWIVTESLSLEMSYFMNPYSHFTILTLHLLPYLYLTILFFLHNYLHYIKHQTLLHPSFQQLILLIVYQLIQCSITHWIIQIMSVMQMHSSQSIQTLPNQSKTL